MKALIISNGSINNKQFHKEVIENQEFDFILCADGGIRLAKELNIIPHMILGDFDSLEKSDINFIETNRIETKRYPAEKNETDTEIALDYLIEMGYDNIILLGCIGSRIDHTLANIYLLKKALYLGITAKIIDDKNIIYLINNHTNIENKKDSIVSLLPFSDVVMGVTTYGLYYPLNNAQLLKEKSRGISNIIIENQAQVQINQGELLIIISKD